LDRFDIVPGSVHMPRPRLPLVPRSKHWLSVWLAVKRMTLRHSFHRSSQALSNYRMRESVQN